MDVLVCVGLVSTIDQRWRVSQYTQNKRSGTRGGIFFERRLLSNAIILLRRASLKHEFAAPRLLLKVSGSLSEREMGVDERLFFLL